MGNSLTSLNEIQTLQFAHEVAKTLKCGDVVCLRGDLGAGKTTFAKGIISALVSELHLDDIASPTFVTMNLYKNIAHFDLYRLKDSNVFIESGFEEYLEEPYIAIIEWPDIIEDLLPKNAINFTIECGVDGLRRIV